MRSIDSLARRKTETETKVKMSNKRCCPKCGSENIDCMDGAGMITEHGGGFIFISRGSKLAYMTDIGCVHESMLNQAAGAQLVFIESNHDVQMLKTGPYPFSFSRFSIAVYRSSASSVKSFSIPP